MSKRNRIAFAVMVVLLIAGGGVVFWQWNSDSELHPEWLNSYIDKYGENPPVPGDDWFHTIDPVNGRVTRVYDGIVAVTGYDIVVGFAPNPDQLGEYIQLCYQLVSAKENDDKLLVEEIKRDISLLKEKAQGEIPKIRGGTYRASGPAISDEEFYKQTKSAERELFRKYGVEHLYGVLY